MKKIRINKAFQSLLPDPRPEEVKILEQSIKQDGQREPIIVWKQTGYILDGHNRFEVLRKLKRKPKAKSLSFADEQAAELWIMETQLGRRNMHPNYYDYYLGKRYEAENKGHGGNRSIRQNDGLKETAERLAKETGKAPRTVERNANFAAGVDKLEAAMPGMSKRILNGATAATKGIISMLGKDEAATVDKLKSIASKKKNEPTALEKELDSLYQKKHPFLDIFPFIGVLDWADKQKKEPTPLARIRSYFKENVSGQYHKKNRTIETAIKLLTSYQEKL